MKITINVPDVGEGLEMSCDYDMIEDVRAMNGVDVVKEFVQMIRNMEPIKENT